MEFLTNKLGPLPAWAWGAMIGGTLIVARLFRGGGSSEEPAAAPADADEFGNYYAPPSSGAVLPWYDARGAVQDAIGSGIPPELIARLEGIEDRIANQPAAPTLEESLADLERIQDVAERIVGGPRAEPAPPPAPVAPPPPPPPAPAPAPPAPTYPQPVSGTIVWTGEEEPRKATIDNLLRARYGRVVPWRAARTGPATARTGPDWVAVLR